MSQRPRPQRAFHTDDSHPYSSPSPSSSSSLGPSGAAQQYHLEGQNDDHVGMLGGRISELKQISLQIGDEVKYQMNYLKEMENDFEKTGGILGKTMKRLRILSQTENGRWMWYLILFVFVVIGYIYFFRFKK
ncbi:hypothetical protein DFS34DRAFT_652663 [Phlyctochytrium arcticum]|nr:hypothetical protein DFS34DRAFT_652663 [Phlyctochytrium arcticum]